MSISLHCIQYNVQRSTSNRRPGEERDMGWSPTVVGLVKRDLLKDVVLAQFGVFSLTE